jgi:hypothetical protein
MTKYMNYAGMYEVQADDTGLLHEVASGYKRHTALIYFSRFTALQNYRCRFTHNIMKPKMTIYKITTPHQHLSSTFASFGENAPSLPNSQHMRTLLVCRH